MNLPDDEVRRLLQYLRKHVDEPDRLAEIEEELWGEYADEFVTSPAMLVYFPLSQHQLFIADEKWLLQIISHAHVRMVQRGVKPHTVLSLFQRFVEYCQARGETILKDAYSIYDPDLFLTLRVDIDFVKEDGGDSHVVTVFFGGGDTSRSLEIVLT